MPITAELHDGRQLEFPDGTDPGVIRATVKKTLGLQAAPATPQPSNFGVGMNAANKAIAGVVDAFGNLPANAANLVNMIPGAIAMAAGKPQYIPDEFKPPDLARRAMTALGAIKPELEPQGTGQRMLDAGVQGGTSMLMNPSRSVGQSIANALTGAVSQTGAQGITEATGSPQAGMLASVLLSAGMSKVGDIARSKIEDAQLRQQQNAPRDQALAAGREAGFVVPPSTVKPTMTNKIIESIAGKAATQQDASLQNVQVVDELARKALNVPPETPLTPEVTQAVRRQAYNSGYAPLANAGQISTGRAYRNALDDIESRYQGASRSFHDAVPSDISDLVAGLRRRSFDAGDAVDMAQVLRDKAGKAYASGDSALSGASKAAANAIEDQIERGLSNQPNASQLVDNFRQARQQMAIAHTVEDAIKVGTGSVDPRKLAGELQKGAPLSGELKVAAEFANNFPKAVQTSQAVGSPGVSKVAALASALMGGAGAAGMGPLGAAAGAVPFVAPPMARGAILSDWYQKHLQPTYDTSLINRAASNIPEPGVGNAFAPLQFAEELRRQQKR